MLNRRTLLKLLGGLGLGALVSDISPALPSGPVSRPFNAIDASLAAARPLLPSDLEQARRIVAIEEWENLLDDLLWARRIEADGPLPGRGTVEPASFCPRCGESTFCEAPCGFTCYAEEHGLTLAETRTILPAEIERGAIQGWVRRHGEVWQVVAEANRFFEHVLWETPEGRPGREFLDAHGIAPQTAKRFALGYCAVNASHQALLQHLMSYGLAADAFSHVIECVPRHAVLFPLRDARERWWGWFCQGCGESGTEAGWAGDACHGVPTNRYRRLVYPLPSWPEDVLRHEAVLCVDRPLEVIQFAQAGLAQAVYPCGLPLRLRFPRGRDAAYRTTLALAARIIFPIESARSTPDHLLRLVENSALPPERVAVLVLPAGKAVADVLREEGSAAVRQRMAQARTVAELLGL